MLDLHPDFSPRSDQPLIVAVSGGADSIALAKLLLHHGYTHLHLCHLNHQLRGSEADGDQAFVEAFAKENNLLITTQNRDALAYAQQHQLSIEVAARQLRHQFYAQVCTSFALETAPPILLGHHADDVAETALLNLVRGSAGLKGISFSSSLLVPEHETTPATKLSIYRPLLPLRKNKLTEYLQEIKQTWREDATNLENFTPRNQLRNKILPQLDQLLNRDATQNLLKAVDHQKELQDAVNQQFPLAHYLDPQGRLYLPSLKTLPIAFQKHLIHQYLKQQNVSNITQEVIQQAYEVLNSTTPPSSLNLAKNKKLLRRQQRAFTETI